MKQSDSLPTDRFEISKQWMRRAEKCDARAAIRSQIRKESRLIEGAYPFYASHARGAYFWDVDGNQYIDYILGYGPVILGHADPQVTEAVVQEIEKDVCISPFWRPTQVRLVELLTSVIPGAELVFLMRTGSDATSGAVRLARIYTGRSKVVRWGYNGWHDWASPRVEGIPRSIQDETLIFRYNDLAFLRALFEAHPDQIACVLMMPFELEPPLPGFLQEVQALAHDYGALFILDEMRSGFRMALGGAQEYFGVQADMATFSKAMANGYAISAITGRADILQCLGRTQMTSTFYANSPEMAAAIATISVLKESDALRRIWTLGEMLQQGLRTLITEYQVPAQVVGYPPCPFLLFTSSNEDEREAAKTIFYSETTRQGVMFHPSHQWFLSAAHTEGDVAYTLDVCRKGWELVRRETIS
jgi:glutamate-1-semialdehyde 2,1-aminomutase